MENDERLHGKVEWIYRNTKLRNIWIRRNGLVE